MAEWRPVVGFERYYKVSDEGVVFSLRNNKIRKPVHNHATGYDAVILVGDNFRKTMTVHRIVASAFLDNPNGYDCVNHKDENKTNNTASNLEWCTKRYNNTYNGKAIKHCKKVISRDPVTGEQKTWLSANEAMRAGVANNRNISACCRGLRNYAGGLEWRFACE